MFSRRQADESKGLTMIEMLVVIGICGVLGLLLVPMVLRARSNARGIVCSDNLKGLGQAYAIALTQSNGILPEAYYTFEGDTGKYNVGLKTAQGQWMGGLFNEGSSNVLTCPSDDTPVNVTFETMGGKDATIPASYAYNVALPLMFRNGSRIRQPLNMITFYDGDLAGVVGEWQHSIGWAEETVRHRHGERANFLYLDGHVEMSGDFPDLAFEGGSQWVASALDTRARVEPQVVTPAAEEPEVDPIDIVIDGGAVIPQEDVTATIICVGAAFQNGENGPRIPVQAYYEVNDDDRTRITNDVRGGETADLGELPAGTEITTIGKTTQYYRSEYDSGDDTGHVWLLRDGDVVPSIAGFAGQRSIQDFLESYVNDDGIVTIGTNDVIFLFELSGQTDYQRYSHADFQDLVVLVHFERNLRDVGGSININPSNSTFEFMMVLPDGLMITRDDLMGDKKIDHEGFNRDYLEYTGPATLVRVKPKGNGNQNGMIVDGEPYDMLNAYVYQVSSDSMTVHLYNNKRKNGRAMGKWWIDITANDAIVKCGKPGKGG